MHRRHDLSQSMIRDTVVSLIPRLLVSDRSLRIDGSGRSEKMWTTAPKPIECLGAMHQVGFAEEQDGLLVGSVADADVTVKLLNFHPNKEGCLRKAYLERVVEQMYVSSAQKSGSLD